jgi:hypothetical protein
MKFNYHQFKKKLAETSGSGGIPGPRLRSLDVERPMDSSLNKYTSAASRRTTNTKNCDQINMRIPWCKSDWIFIRIFVDVQSDTASLLRRKSRFESAYIFVGQFAVESICRVFVGV